MFRVELDRDACEGIFACLVRDDRFVEDEAGLATVDPDAAGVVDVDREGERVIATFEGGVDDAELAAAACPPNAITVRAEDDTTTDPGGER
ncbi:ferredoxin [Halobellus marinus]|jgi:ferredoxin|uniref:ferredoxin n=1 Tax=Halobellus TaxID=1073986 RepID=UPI0028A934DB|nr:ferredoxin [Halobellus sp. DFY28]